MCVHMQLDKDRPSFTLYLNGSAIPQNNGIKYLDVYIQSDLKWHPHTLEITKKSNKARGLITRCLFNVSSDTKMIFFNTIVRPILEHASPVWSSYNKGLIEKLEKVQRRAVKYLKVSQTAWKIIPLCNLKIGERNYMKKLSKR